MSAAEPLLTPLADASLRVGDVLLFRADWRDPGSFVIARGTDTIYDHAGILAQFVPVWAYVDHGMWSVIDTRLRQGCCATSLAVRVAQEPSRIDVYRVKHGVTWNAQRAVIAAYGETGKAYGTWTLAKVALRRFVVLRLFFHADLRDYSNGTPRFCSDLVSYALRAGGIDPVNNKPDNQTTPGDLATSAILDYQCTLVP